MGFVLESLGKTDLTNYNESQKACVSVKVAHKIGDADEFKHDTAIKHTIFSVLSIFTQNSDYDTIAKINKDVYEVLKWGNQDFKSFSPKRVFRKHSKVLLALSGGLDSLFLTQLLSTNQMSWELSYF